MKTPESVKTPEFLIQKKALLNPLTSNKKSFIDSITLSLYHKRTGKNNYRPNKIRKYSDIFYWEILIFHQQRKIVNNLK